MYAVRHLSGLVHHSFKGPCCLMYPPEQIAAAAVHTLFTLASEPMPSEPGREWWVPSQQELEARAADDKKSRKYWFNGLEGITHELLDEIKAQILLAGGYTASAKGNGATETGATAGDEATDTAAGVVPASGRAHSTEEDAAGGVGRPSAAGFPRGGPSPSFAAAPAHGDRAAAEQQHHPPPAKRARHDGGGGAPATSGTGGGAQSIPRAAVAGVEEPGGGSYQQQQAAANGASHQGPRAGPAGVEQATVASYQQQQQPAANGASRQGPRAPLPVPHYHRAPASANGAGGKPPAVAAAAAAAPARPGAKAAELMQRADTVEEGEIEPGEVLP